MRDRTRYPGVMRAVLAALLCAWLIGCGEDMSDQPRYEALEGSAFFDDGMSSRPPVPGTVPRGSLHEDERVATGVGANGAAVKEIPLPVTAALLEHGRTQFNIICANCHGRVGDGRGIIVERGFPPPPSYHIDRLRSAPAGHLFGVVSNGYGRMLPFADQLSVRDRWAVIAYIRALQRSQHAKLDDVPADAAKRLREEAGDE